MLQSMGSQKVGHDLATEQRTTVRSAALSGLPQPSLSCDVISSLPASYKYESEWSQVLSSEASVKPCKSSLEFLLPLQICGNTDLKKKKKSCSRSHTSKQQSWAENSGLSPEYSGTIGYVVFHRSLKQSPASLCLAFSANSSQLRLDHCKLILS